ncbi:hypothetical protein BpHYR1_015914 [Brachionus plicatilis]|uniref:Uncharacterized protein n=1 Tax=Brachionus plicatilis TaxID=10195 RepID=A0A3M7P3S4_BRAPC|nr:hypothetical protein BpHYR1_015914 [Brachionus plicatilis]
MNRLISEIEINKLIPSLLKIFLVHFIINYKLSVLYITKNEIFRLLMKFSFKIEKNYSQFSNKQNMMIKLKFSSEDPTYISCIIPKT